MIANPHRPASPRRGAWRAWLCAGLLGLALLELGLRGLAAAYRNQPGIQTPNAPDLENVMMPDPDTIWAMRPGVRGVPIHSMNVNDETLLLERVFHVATDAHGMRDVPNRPGAPRRRVLAVGDSTTFGLGVESAEAWTGQLQSIANESAPEEAWGVFNAGVTGHSVVQARNTIQRLVPVVRPELVVLTVGNNDPTVAGPWSDSGVIRRNRWSAPGSLVPMLWTVGSDLATEALTPRAKYVQRVSLPEFKRAIADLRAWCAERGILLIMLRWPWQAQVVLARDGREQADNWPQYAYQQFLLDAATGPGVVCVDLLPVFAAHPEDVYFDAVHVDATGNRLVAGAVWRAARDHVADGE